MEKGGGQLVDAPSFVDLCTLHQHAMRYYRLWIYACNIVIAIATLSFVLSALTFFVDPRLYFLNGLELHQPTFLYAYAVIVFQSGIFQMIGCVGALRLHRATLIVYWCILVGLLFSDIFVGLYWTIRLNKIKSNVRPDLMERLSFQYGNDSQFTQRWEWLQRTDVCCGVDGPADYFPHNDSSHLDNRGLPFDISSGAHPKLPSSCCVFTMSHLTEIPIQTQINNNNHNVHSRHQNASHHHHQQAHQRSHKVPYYPNNNFTVHYNSFSSGSGSGTHNRRRIVHNTLRKNETSQSPNTVRSNVQTTTETSNRKVPSHGICALPPDIVAKYNKYIYIKVSDTVIESYQFEGSGSSSEEGTTEFPSTTISLGDHSSPNPTYSTSSPPHPSSSPGSSFSTASPSYLLVSMSLNEVGCSEKVLAFADRASDTLLIIGFCVIVFIKVAAVFLLRYELIEMLEKIKLLSLDEDGRAAAMNQLIHGIPMTPMDPKDSDDDAEREGLMARATIESDNATISGSTRDQHNHRNPNTFNHVGEGAMGNHVSTSAAAATTTVLVGSGSDEFENALVKHDRKSRNENGGKNIPRNSVINGNNNATAAINARGGVTPHPLRSASAPIPIESMATQA